MRWVAAILDARPVARLRLRFRDITLSQLWAFVAIALPLLGALAARMSITDLGYQLRAGDTMLSTHHILRTDTMSFTHAGGPWVNQQWGAEVLLALVYRAGAWSGLVLLRTALIGVTFLLIYRTCRMAGTSQRVAAALTLGSFVVASPNMAVRAQLFALPLFALAMWIIQKRDARPALLWLLVPISALWANLHGSFFLVPLLLGLAFLGDFRRAQLLASRGPSQALRGIALHPDVPVDRF